jgi:hypothetical protein
MDDYTAAQQHGYFTSPVIFFPCSSGALIAYSLNRPDLRVLFCVYRTVVDRANGHCWAGEF